MARCWRKPTTTWTAATSAWWWAPAAWSTLQQCLHQRSPPGIRKNIIVGSYFWYNCLYGYRRGVPVAEFNLECTPATDRISSKGKGFFFEGPCGTSLPAALEP